MMSIRHLFSGYGLPGECVFALLKPQEVHMLRSTVLAAASLFFSTSAVAGPGPCSDPVVDGASAWAYVSCMVDYTLPIALDASEAVLDLQSTAAYLSGEVDTLWTEIGTIWTEVDDLDDRLDDLDHLGDEDLVWIGCWDEDGFDVTIGEVEIIQCFGIANYARDEAMVRQIDFPDLCTGDLVAEAAWIVDSITDDVMMTSLTPVPCGETLSFVEEEDFLLRVGWARVLHLEVVFSGTEGSVQSGLDPAYDAVVTVGHHKVDPNETRPRARLQGYEHSVE
jgi:hypothetical protein